MRRAAPFLAAAVVLICPAPAFATDYANTVSFRVPVTVTNWTMPAVVPQLGLACMINTAGTAAAMYNSGFTHVPLQMSGGKANYAGTMTLVVKIPSGIVVHSGDKWACFFASLGSGSPIYADPIFGMNVTSSSVAASGTLP